MLHCCLHARVDLHNFKLQIGCWINLNNGVELVSFEFLSFFSSLNMTNPMTELIDNGAYAVEHGRDQGRHGTLNHAQGALDPDVELRRDIVRLERKVRNAICYHSM